MSMEHLSPQREKKLLEVEKKLGTKDKKEIFQYHGGLVEFVKWVNGNKEVLHKPFSITDLKVNGEDVMETLNIPPGRKVGEVLESLLQEVQEDQSKNNREYLLERIKQLY